MSNRIITIDREYASGGREVGEMVAQKLGIPFYNREILQMASERCNVSPEYLETAEEAAPKSFLYTLMLTSSPTHTIEETLPLSDKVYIIETNIRRELAEKSDCVIVGRCVNYVFKDRPNTLRVFIHAPWEFRVEKASEKISGSREDVEKFLLKDDKRKQDYYRKFAGGIWNDATNYDLCLNSGKLGFEKCVDAIEAQLKIMLNK